MRPRPAALAGAGGERRGLAAGDRGAPGEEVRRAVEEPAELVLEDAVEVLDGVRRVEGGRGDPLELDRDVHGLVPRERVVEGAQRREAAGERVAERVAGRGVVDLERAGGRRIGVDVDLDGARVVVEELVGEALLHAAREEVAGDPRSTQYELCVEMRHAASKGGELGGPTSTIASPWPSPHEAARRAAAATDGRWPRALTRRGARSRPPSRRPRRRRGW